MKKYFVLILQTCRIEIKKNFHRIGQIVVEKTLLKVLKKISSYFDGVNFQLYMFTIFIKFDQVIVRKLRLQSSVHFCGDLM